MYSIHNFLISTRTSSLFQHLNSSKHHKVLLQERGELLNWSVKQKGLPLFAMSGSTMTKASQVLIDVQLQKLATCIFHVFYIKRKKVQILEVIIALSLMTMVKFKVNLLISPWDVSMHCTQYCNTVIFKN